MGIKVVYVSNQISSRTGVYVFGYISVAAIVRTWIYIITEAVDYIYDSWFAYLIP